MCAERNVHSLGFGVGFFPAKKMIGLCASHYTPPTRGTRIERCIKGQALAALDQRRCVCFPVFPCALNFTFDLCSRRHPLRRSGRGMTILGQNPLWRRRIWIVV